MSEIPIDINISGGLIAIGVLLLSNGVLAMVETIPPAKQADLLINTKKSQYKNTNRELVGFQKQWPASKFVAGECFWVLWIKGQKSIGY